MLYQTRMCCNLSLKCHSLYIESELFPTLHCGETPVLPVLKISRIYISVLFYVLCFIRFIVYLIIVFVFYLFIPRTFTDKFSRQRQNNKNATINFFFFIVQSNLCSRWIKQNAIQKQRAEKNMWEMILVTVSITFFFFFFHMWPSRVSFASCNATSFQTIKLGLALLLLNATNTNQSCVHTKYTQRDASSRPKDFPTPSSIPKSF